MSVKIIQPGFFSTIQDNGRIDGLPYGVPISGAMDGHLYRFANQSLNNSEGLSSIEFYQQGLQLKFLAPTFFCVAILEGKVLLNGERIDTNSIYRIKSGDELIIKEMIVGNWGYVAVKDGFAAKQALGSQSYYKPLTDSQLQKDDEIRFNSFEGDNGGDSPQFDLDYYSPDILDVYPGPEFQKLSQTLKYQLQNAEFTLSSSLNRMAYQVNERLDNDLEEIVTGPVLPGTIQYTPEGKMIVLMRDAQVTGGYPRILQLSEVAINKLSQKRPKSGFNFNLIEINSEKI